MLPRRTQASTRELTAPRESASYGDSSVIGKPFDEQYKQHNGEQYDPQLSAYPLGKPTRRARSEAPEPQLRRDVQTTFVGIAQVCGKPSQHLAIWCAQSEKPGTFTKEASLPVSDRQRVF